MSVLSLLSFCQLSVVCYVSGCYPMYDYTLSVVCLVSISAICCRLLSATSAISCLLYVLPAVCIRYIGCLSVWWCLLSAFSLHFIDCLYAVCVSAGCFLFVCCVSFVCLPSGCYMISFNELYVVFYLSAICFMSPFFSLVSDWCMLSVDRKSADICLLSLLSDCLLYVCLFSSVYLSASSPCCLSVSSLLTVCYLLYFRTLSSVCMLSVRLSDIYCISVCCLPAISCMSAICRLSVSDLLFFIAY